MTATTTAAVHAWNALVAGDWPGFLALEYVMDADGCERAVALAKLCGLAATTVKRLAPRGRKLGSLNAEWRSRGQGNLIRTIRRGDLTTALRVLSGLRSWPDKLVARPDMYFLWATEPAYPYVVWCDQADAAIALLRELTAIPGGEQ